MSRGKRPCRPRELACVLLSAERAGDRLGAPLGAGPVGVDTGEALDAPSCLGIGRQWVVAV